MGADAFYIGRVIIRFPACPSSMSEPAPPHDAVSVIEQEFIVDEPCPVAVDLPRARVHLRPGAESDRVGIRVSVSGCPPADADAALDKMQVNTQQVKDTVRVTAASSPAAAEWWRWVRTSDVTLHVALALPRRIEADLRIPGGEVDVEDLGGEIDLKVMGGVCEVTNLSGQLSIRAESTDVAISDFSGTDLDVRVAVGRLTLEDVEADTLELQSVAAPVELRNVRGASTITTNSTELHIEDPEGPCTARSQGGAVTFDGRPTDDTELTVVGAPLTVRLPADHAADLAMQGETLSLDERFAFEGERTDHMIEGTLNDGGPSLLARAVGGSGACRIEAVQA